MSDYLSVAVVTATLHGIVQNAVDEAVPGGRVRVGIPKPPAEASGAEVNLYLYHITPNAALRNSALPWREQGGVVRETPRVAVDLHYLISFFGEKDLEAERMLGRVMTALEAEPVITAARIQSTIDSSSYTYLKHSNLVHELDRIKLTAEYLSLEDLTKLWTVFFQIAHRPSLQYIACPVLADSTLPGSLNPKVKEVKVV